MGGRGVSRTWNNYTRRLRACRAPRERQQRDIASALDGHAQPALMPRANARHTAGQNLSALLHELRKNVRALVVDEVHLLDAELANLFLAEILALAAWPASGTARSARAAAPWTAFASRTAMPAAVAAFPPRRSARR
jgi:hypothetical protein